MDDTLKAIAFLLKIASLSFTLSAAFTLGAAAVCRWLEWAPINITIKSISNGNEGDKE